MRKKDNRPQENSPVESKTMVSTRGDVRPKGIGKVEKRIKTFFSVFTEARKKANRSRRTETVESHLDFKLAQRLDSAGYADFSQDVASMSEKRPGLLTKIIESWKKRSLAQHLAIGGGTLVSTVLIFGFVGLALIWYRGMDIPVLRNFSAQSVPVLQMTKTMESEYGVAISDNVFTITSGAGVGFRSLGLTNKVEVVPYADVAVKLSSDGRSISIVPFGDLEPDTEYTVTLKSGTMFTDGSHLMEDYSWVFRTEPEFVVTGITPRDGTDSAPIDTTIEVEFTYKDIDPDVFADYFSIVPAVTGKYELHGKKMVFLPAEDLVSGTVYEVTMREGFPRSTGETLPNTVTSTFKVSYNDSSGVYIPSPGMYWSEYEPIISVTQDPWIGIQSYTINGNIAFTLYSATDAAVVDVMKDYAWDIFKKPDPSTITKIADFTKTQQQARFFKVDLQDYGIYFLEAYNADFGRSIYKFLVYSPVGLLISDAAGSERVWLNDMDEKESLGGGRVNFYDFDRAVVPVHSAVTDANGYAVMDEGGTDLVIGVASGNYAIVTTERTWWSEMWHADVEDTQYRAFVYTDKPLYRQGEIVQFKAVVRLEDDMSYGLPSVEQVTVRVGNGGSYFWNGLRTLPLYEETFEVSKDYGTVVGEFELPANVDPGYENVSVYVGSDLIGSSAMTVGDYQKPKHTIDMDIDTTLGFSGDSVGVSVRGSDYSGDSAAGLKVALSVSKGEVTSVNWLGSSEDLNREQMRYYGSDTVVDTTLTLNSQGMATYTFPIDVSDYDTKLGVYSVNVRSDDEYVAHDSDTVVAADSEVALFAKPDSWSVAEGGDNELTLKTVQLWDFEVEGGVRVEYDITRTWTEWVEDGDYYDPATKTTKPLYTPVKHTEDVLTDQEATTDADGYASIGLTDLEHGSYSLSAVYYNGSGVSREFSDLFYVYEASDDGGLGFGDWSSMNQKSEIYLDKEEYEVGDTAAVTIKSTLGGKGVYLVSRGDTYEWRIVDFSSGIVELQQDITEEMSPVINICVWGIDEYLSVQDPVSDISQEYLSNVFISTCTSVEIYRDYGRLNVSVASGQTTYEPGAEATLNIRVTDQSGKGVRAELSVDAVDRALLDIARGNSQYESDIHNGFYGVVNQWAYQKGSLFQYSYYGWGAGGGGGGTSLRSNFADVAYWDGRIRTDAAGRATVKFVLPDDLTTWAVQVRAVTEDPWVGQGSVDFVARKDMRLDAKIPQYLRTGDDWTMNLEASNYSEVILDGQVTVECDGCTDSSFVKNVRLSPGSRQMINVPISPDSGSTELVITSLLKSGTSTKDAVEWTVPVIPVGFVQNDTRTSLLWNGEDTGTMSFNLPTGTHLLRTDLRLTAARSYVNEWALVPVDPSVSSSVELASSIIHNSLLLTYYDEIRPSQSKAEFEKKITSAMDLLSVNQAESGGFGWFDYDAVSFELSAYVGIAYGRASAAGMAPEGGRMDNLQEYLWKGLDSSETSIDEKILAVYSLAEMGDSTVLPYALSLKNQQDEFADSPLDIAHLMLALQKLGSAGDAGELIPLLGNLADVSGRAATWEDSDVAFRVVHSVEYTTAVVYQALALYEGLAVADLAQNWLIDNPVSVYGSSADSVAIFYALTVSNIENLSGRSGVNKVTISVNGKDVRTFDVGGDEDWIGTVDLLVPASYLRTGENTVTIKRSGGGDLYVVGNLTYYTDSSNDPAEFTVRRSVRGLTSGNPATSFTKGQAMIVHTEVTVDRDAYTMEVKEILPSGFEPVQYQLSGFDYSLYSKWWKWGCGNYVNRYGSVAQDHVTFTEYSVKKGLVYTFEYPAVATYTGVFTGGGAQSFLLNLGDIGGYVLSPEVTVGD